MTSRLASLVVQDGLVSAKKMAEAFQRQVIYGGTLDTILLEMDVIDEPTLVDALGRSAQLPTAGDLPSAEALQAAGASRWFAHSVCERYRAVPISLEGNALRVLVTDPVDRKQLDELGFMLSLGVDPIVVPEHRFVQAVELVYNTPMPARYASLGAKLRQRAAEQPGGRTNPSMAPLVPSLLVPKPSAPAKAAEPVAEKPVEAPRRAVLTDVPMPQPRAERAAPAVEQREDPTLRFPSRQVAAPVAPVAEQRIERVEESPVVPVPSPVAPAIAVEEPESAALAPGDAVRAIDEAGDRDAIFALVCRGARSLLDYVALLTVQGAEAHGRLALADRWIDRALLSRISLPLDKPSPLQTAAQTHAPFLGRMGDEPIGASALQSLGRRAPQPALLVPITMRDRTVALLYADAGGGAVAAEVVAELSTLTAAAARAFQRLILRQKGGEFSKAAGSAGAKLESSTAPEAKGGAWGRASNANAGRVAFPEKQARALAAAAGGVETPESIGRQAAAAASRETGAREAAAREAAAREAAARDSALREMPTREMPTREMPTVRPEAAPRVTLHELPTEKLADAAQLVAAVSGEDEDFAARAAERLLAMGERGALAVVAAMPGPLKLARHSLRGPIPSLSQHGPLLAVIARFGRAAMTPLLARLNDPSSEVRYYATLAVGDLGAQETVAPLGARLFDAEGGVRAVAIAALQKNSPENLRQLAESLRGELPGPDPTRQEHAAEALGALHDASSVPRLIDLVKHSDTGVALSARHALLDITKQDFGTSRWRWKSWWERHRNEPRVEWLLEGLGHSEAAVRESAADELRALASDDFGYHFDQPKREREEARKRWVDWWRTTGSKLHKKN